MAVALSVACGGDDDSGNEGNGGSNGEAGGVTGYFQQLSAIGALANVQLLTLEQRFPSLDEVEPVNQYQTEYVGIVDTLVGQLNDLSPPEELADQHEAYVAASEELQQAAQARLDSLQSAASPEDLEAVLADNAQDEALAKQDFACSELKRVADEEGVPVPGLQDCDSFN
jgi:hypothetical protein